MKTKVFYTITIVLFAIISCQDNKIQNSENIRDVVDTIGFATESWQMDSVIVRIHRTYTDKLVEIESNLSSFSDPWKVAICPHDDYVYAGYLYVPTLSRVKAKTIILFGVAHKARNFELEDQLIFDDYDGWKGPNGIVQVSSYREELMDNLKEGEYTVHRDMHTVEHSLEALVPFLQYYNPDVEIIPVLVPYMSFYKMQELAHSFSESIYNLMQKENLNWGNDIALVISTDAVHYGDKDWGGKDYAPYGVDSAGYLQAVEHEYEIIRNTLNGELALEKIQRLTNYTVQEENYKDYKWTWCGRYSIPAGLLTAYELSILLESPTLSGRLIGYANSIDHPVLEVTDLNMGTTAPANIRHWVGYVAVGY